MLVRKTDGSYSVHIDDSFPIPDRGLDCESRKQVGTWRENLTAHRIPVDSFQRNERAA
jgi:hypothetical protein